MLWDIFCKVIDNHGDIGVCWRLSAQLAQQGQAVRLWVDDPSALQWMAPQGHAGVDVRAWRGGVQWPEPGDAVIEAFGCELPPEFQALMAQRWINGRQPAWINLEYLTAEAFAERSHGLPSPVLAGPAAGLTKHFFYPGFTASTGGLLREQDLVSRHTAFDKAAWLRAQHIELGDNDLLVSLFCYEPGALGPLLDRLGESERPVKLLVTHGRATAAVAAVLRGQRAAPNLSIVRLPLLSQQDFDDLLWSCDLNFVRGEDSLVRALWAGKPFIWQLYPQDDDAHHAKLFAFLDQLQASASLRAFHEAWNGLRPGLPDLDLPAWASCALAARARLLAQEDLVAQLLRFVGFTEGRK